MDSDGYPEEEVLAQIRAWDADDFAGLMELIEREWWYPEYIEEDDHCVWHVSTGGWSGNEELIGAMRENQMWWMFYAHAWRAGGHFLFAPQVWSGRVRFVVEDN